MFGSHREIIGAWPSLKAFGDDIGMSENAIKQMRRRSSIHWEYWDDVIRGAKRRRIKGVSHDVLKRLSPKRRGKNDPLSTAGCAA